MNHVDRPVFLIGMGRSGTTLIFEALARSRELGWFPNHLDHFPRVLPFGSLTRLCDLSDAFRKQIVPNGKSKRRFERLRVGPTEGWGVWQHACGEKFLHDYLLGISATDRERKRLRTVLSALLRWEGKPRFAAKLTGPARLGYLLSIFPDARFVHIVRDGRSVVDSLLHVSFWANSFRMTRPTWEGGLTDEDRQAWEDRGRDPAILAALQWRAVIERTWEERDRHHPEVFHEVRYEDFVANPAAEVHRICDALEVTMPPRAWRWLENGAGIQPVNRTPGERLPAGVRDGISTMLADVLEHYGYA